MSVRVCAIGGGRDGWVTVDEWKGFCRPRVRDGGPSKGVRGPSDSGTRRSVSWGPAEDDLGLEGPNPECRDREAEYSRSNASRPWWLDVDV